MQHTPLLIGILVTNGVSFSLVAGACCAIYFANAPSKIQHSSSGSDCGLKMTLNISSTGAKPLFSAFGGYQVMIDDGKYWVYIPNSCFIVYNGTQYCNLYNGARGTSANYGDYLD